MDLFKLLRFERDRNTNKKRPRDDADKLSLGATGLLAQLGTYGQGDNITASLTTWADLFGTTRVTVRKYRDELIAKGFLVDLTPERSSRIEHVYKLTHPGEAENKEDRPVKRNRITTINARTFAEQTELEAREVVDRELARAEAEREGVYVWEGEHAREIKEDLAAVAKIRKLPRGNLGNKFLEAMDDLKIKIGSEESVIGESLTATEQNAESSIAGYFLRTLADRLNLYRAAAEISAQKQSHEMPVQRDPEPGREIKRTNSRAKKNVVVDL